LVNVHGSASGLIGVEDSLAAVAVRVWLHEERH
jgi:hypothetical protein